MFKNYHKNEQFNFQMNRFLEVYQNENDVQEEVKQASLKLKDFESWYKVWFTLGKKRENKNEYAIASCYYQLAEFFLSEEDERKLPVYNLFKDTFYKSIDTSQMTFIQIPYENTFMPGVIIRNNKQTKKTLIIHGGFDSYLEELIRIVNLFEPLDEYQFVLFEGPGQGEMIRKKVPMISNWEKPVTAVLDYCNLIKADLMGMSLGGYLCMRAAAFEPRIEKVVAFDIMYSMNDAFKNKLDPKQYQFIESALKNGNEHQIDELLSKEAELNIDLNFKLSKGYAISNTHKPSELLKYISTFSLEGIEDKITQEVLLMAGTEDFYVPTNRLPFLINKLVNVKKLEAILYTERSGGAEHCQVGNKKLAFTDISAFLLKDR
ncbi:alpha/beta hydrolase [Enterococcus sp. AZ101]|uniref:alpha/beta hydrolase n=1 Tax=Enterococcus sp. AZ101 TaxID=2774742 RepID=UPI003D2D93B0